MKLVRNIYVALYKPIGASIGLLSMPFFFNNTIVYISVGFLLVLTWCHKYYCLSIKYQHSIALLKRVDELKRFSLELQALINHELYLLQGDVSRLHSIALGANKILQDNIDSFDKSRSTSTNNKRAVEGLRQAVIKALQVEDINGQTSQHVIKHIDEIISLINMLTEIHSYELTLDFNSRLYAMQSKMRKLKAKLFEFHTKKPVTSDNMNTGDIELF